MILLNEKRLLLIEFQMQLSNQNHYFDAMVKAETLQEDIFLIHTIAVFKTYKKKASGFLNGFYCINGFGKFASM